MKHTGIGLKQLFWIAGSVIAVSAQSEVPNKIDAFTSATKSLKIDSIIVYKTKALVYWKEYWPDDMEVQVYQLKWGPKSSSFEDSLNLQPFKEKTIRVDTIQPLVENTEYIGQFNRDYNRKLYNHDFLFNTPPLPNKISFSRPSLNRPSKIAGIAIHTIDGKLISTRNISSRSAITASVDDVVRSPGLYIINITDLHGDILAAETILVGN